MVRNNTLLYILTLYGILLAVPLLFFVLYIIFKIPEREKDKVFKEETKRKATEFARESAQGSKS
jgi:predicted membrane protein